LIKSRCYCAALTQGPALSVINNPVRFPKKKPFDAKNLSKTLDVAKLEFEVVYLYLVGPALQIRRHVIITEVTLGFPQTKQQKWREDFKTY